MIRPLAHYGIHLVFPLVVALLLYRSQWKRAYLVMLMGLLIDLDHLLANPIFDPSRCSINFHPLHSYWAIMIYVLGLIPKKTRLLAIGLIIHILADQVDCWLL